MHENAREIIVGVRRVPTAPVEFCTTGTADLPHGCRVLIATASGETAEAVVAIPPALIITAPPLAGVPRVVEVWPEPAAGELEVPAGIDFLPASDSALGPADLARALQLAALPVPEGTAERR